MPRTFAKLYLSVWDDPDFLALTGDAQRLYLVLFSHKKLSLAGVLPLQPRQWAKTARDALPETVEEALRELVEARFVVVDEDTEEALVRTFVRHDGGATNSNVHKAIRCAIDQVASKRLRATIEYQLALARGEEPQHPDPSEAPTEHPSEHPSEAPSEAPSVDPSEAPTEAPTERVTSRVTSLLPTTNYQLPPSRRLDSSPDPPAPRAVVEAVGTAEGERQRNPVFDALVEACGWRYNEMTTRQRRACGVAASELAKVGATPEEIPRRARAYRQKYQRAALTPSALANQWASLTAAACDDDGSRTINGVRYSADALRRM
jgi:hypothetical protein